LSYVIRVSRDEGTESDEIAVTPRIRRILERAADITTSKTGKRFIGTESLLRVLADDKEGIAGQVLQELGVRDAVRQRLDEIMSSPAYTQTSRGPDRPA
jgi:ATP-dependent Clp protease ATP-binding subunit ClpA